MAALSKTRVMFVCLGNACRSPMAEAIARQEFSDVLEITSAGLTPMGYLPAQTIRTLTRNGYSTEGLTSKSITPEALRATELVLNMSGDTRSQALAGARDIEHWPVPDPYGDDDATYQTILEDIQQRIRDLANRLSKKPAGKRPASKK